MVKRSVEQLKDLRVYFENRDVLQVKLSEADLEQIEAVREHIQHDAKIVNHCIATALSSSDNSDERAALISHANKGLAAILSKTWIPFVHDHLIEGSKQIQHFAYAMELDDITTMKFEAYAIPYNCGVVTVVSVQICLTNEDLLICFLPMLVFEADETKDNNLINVARQRLSKAYEDAGNSDVVRALSAFEKAMRAPMYS